jgi:hypothetical protein
MTQRQKDAAKAWWAERKAKGLFVPKRTKAEKRQRENVAQMARHKANPEIRRARDRARYHRKKHDG